MTSKDLRKIPLYTESKDPYCQGKLIDPEKYILEIYYFTDNSSA
jgi:hypothetical protein